MNDTGLIPFLAVTGAPTEADVRAKVAAIQADGADSFLVYARSGLGVPYMGEEWLRLCGWFCDEAAKRGLKVWLYDEYNWPSGTCKGRVPAENDAWRYREIGAFPRTGGGWFWEEAIAPAGWVNVCEPDAVRRFIELTHDVYAKRLAKWFADGTIVGFFTDEPGHPVGIVFPSGKPRASFRAWAGMEEEYRAETGRDFRADVEAWLEGGAGGADVPAIYARLLGRRFRAAFFDQLRAWCDAHGVALTGHMIEENSITNSCRFNGDPMLCLRGETIPGMDEIGSCFDPDGATSPNGRPVEWLTFNMARQAIIHNGRGGAAELFACGPADLPPPALRQMVWLCAFHGIDRYVTCMDVMDERGLVEKHGWLSGAGPVHPWYARHARLLADEARLAAAFAAKPVSEREVGVRHPDRAAAWAACTIPPGGSIRDGRNQPVPDVNGLLRELETHQFVPRLIMEDEPCDLPLVFSCRQGGLYDEEKTGSAGLDAAGAVALCRERLPASFRVFETDGATEAEDILVRTCASGESAVLNVRPFATRRLIAERGGNRCAFLLPPRGVKVFAPGALPPDEPEAAATRFLADAKWTLRRDRPNLLRVRFPENAGHKGAVLCAEGVEARPLLRECAISYAVTPSGRPIGEGEEAPRGEKIIRHDAEPYSFAIDGELPRLDGNGEVSGDVLPPVFASLYRAAERRRFARGAHSFEIVSGEADVNYFLPALWLAGDFRVFGDTLFAEDAATVGYGSFAALGYPHYAGGLAWSATVAAPGGIGWRLRADIGGSVASIRFCGVELGVRAWDPFEWELPDALAGKTGELEITVVSTAMPMFGPHEVEGKTWDVEGWGRLRTPGAACGLFSAAWVKYSVSLGGGADFPLNSERQADCPPPSGGWREAPGGVLRIAAPPDAKWALHGILPPAPAGHPPSRRGANHRGFIGQREFSTATPQD